MRCFTLLPAVVVASLVATLSAQSVANYDSGNDYQAFCSSCHGVAGTGDGVFAPSLKRRPPDLTQLAKRNGGIFPSERVLKTVKDGASTHGGSPDMTEWASVFTKSRESGTADGANGRIRDLVRYINTMQDRR